MSWVQNLTSLHWCPAQVLFTKLAQPSCSCGRWANSSLENGLLLTEPLCPQGWLQPPDDDGVTWGDGVPAKSQFPCPQEGQLQDGVYGPGVAPLPTHPGIRSQLDSTGGYIPAQFLPGSLPSQRPLPPQPASLALDAPSHLLSFQALSKPQAAESLPQAPLIET